MPTGTQTAYVQTISERCRMCYTCVRECPVKAIKIVNGQAEVLPERCICCGNCVRVCSQNAKRIVESTDPVQRLLDSGERVAACLAPSFPAEFADVSHTRLVGMLRRLGFDLVCQVAFGADLVAGAYKRLLEDGTGRRWIATSCPAVVEYVQRYHPGIVGRLAPIISPMIATARAVKHLYGPDVRVVFIGPCIAKKLEATSPLLDGDVDAAITFTLFRELIETRGVRADAVEDSQFDPPHPRLGGLFPITRGLFQAADVEEDLLSGNVVAADGRQHFIEAISEFEDGALEAELLEVLCCTGCIMGAGMSVQTPLFERRSRVGKYVRDMLARTDEAEWRECIRRCAGVDLTRTYRTDDRRLPTADDAQIEKILAQMGKTGPEDELNCGACGYDTCREHALAILNGLAESEMCLPYTIDQLRKAFRELEVSHEELASAQAALIQAEKLAHMGQLAAGIAHEVNNPLGVILLYAHMLLEDVRDPETREDLSLVVEQANRCKRIVSGLLQFARRNKTLLEDTDIFELVRRCATAATLADGVDLRVERACENAVAAVDADQIAQVVTNLLTNAQDAMDGSGTLSVRVCGDDEHVYLHIRDTGPGIPLDLQSKIFEPFFTTKQIGDGTGLGLAVTYGIVKMHHGDITVKSNADAGVGPTFAEFTVRLPRAGRPRDDHESR